MMRFLIPLMFFVLPLNAYSLSGIFESGSEFKINGESINEQQVQEALMNIDETLPKPTAKVLEISRGEPIFESMMGEEIGLISIQVTLPENTLQEHSYGFLFISENADLQKALFAKHPLTQFPHPKTESERAMARQLFEVGRFSMNELKGYLDSNIVTLEDAARLVEFGYLSQDQVKSYQAHGVLTDYQQIKGHFFFHFSETSLLNLVSSDAMNNYLQNLVLDDSITTGSNSNNKLKPITLDFQLKVYLVTDKLKVSQPALIRIFSKP